MSQPSDLRATLPGRVASLAKQHGNKVALREKHLGLWRELTWSDYLDNVAAAAHALWEAGVRTGDHVAILSSNRPEWLFADLGAQTIGARSVGIYETSPASDVAYILDHSQSKVVVCEDQEQVDKAIEVVHQTPTVEHVIVIDARGTRGYDDPRLRTWEEFAATGHSLREQQPQWMAEKLTELDPRAAAMIVYTSGTTGQPKGAMLSSLNTTANADELAAFMGARTGDTLLSYLPLCHVAEKIFTLYLPLTVGAVAHFGEAIETVQRDLREVSPTIFLGVPRIWEKIHANVEIKMRDSSWLKRTLYRTCVRLGRRIAARRIAGTQRWIDRLQYALADMLVFRALQERLGLRNCRIAVSGAAPIAPELLEWFHAIGVPILEGYGMTECAGVSHINPYRAVRLGTVGVAAPMVECRTAEDGEILIHGPNVFLGYLHNEEATRETIDDDGWLHTGDVGEIDDDGYLRITGRKKEIIITAGGKNISPEKIENSHKMSPYIKEIIAIGDARKFVSALVQIDLDSVGDWASRRKIEYTSYPDLAGKPQVRDLIASEIRKGNDALARVEQVREFRILPKELHQDDGELTATQKVRRRAVHEKFAELIEEMYSK